MAEYKNGVNAFGNMSVSKEDRSAEVKTGRAVFVDEDKYANDADYKLKVDKCLAEGFHRVGESGGGSSDFSTATVTFESTSGTYAVTITEVVEEYGLCSMANRAVVTGGGEGTVTVIVPLYKGCYALSTGCITGTTSTPTVTGNLEFDGEFGLTITGDGTFTAAGH